jgi:hypothetical protein
MGRGVQATTGMGSGWGALRGDSPAEGGSGRIAPAYGLHNSFRSLLRKLPVEAEQVCSEGGDFPPPE